MSNVNFSNHFLIAMPSRDDSVFTGTVVYVCEHNERGALGVVINKVTNMMMDDFFGRVEIKLDTPALALSFSHQAVMFGGPVQGDRGFVLHVPGGDFSSTLKVTDDVSYTTSKDVLQSIASGLGPEKFLVSVGYVGWEKNQLETEIAENRWLVVEATPMVLFELPVEQRYSAAIKLLGIDPMMLSYDIGHA